MIPIGINDPLTHGASGFFEKQWVAGPAHDKSDEEVLIDVVAESWVWQSVEPLTCIFCAGQFDVSIPTVVVVACCCLL